MQEEVVKYMSKVPGYLERGDKALNLGVLDWGRVEQWQSNQTHKSCQLSHMERSPHSQNDALFRRSTLHHHLLFSPAGFHKQRTFSSEDAVRKSDSRSSSPSKFLSSRMSSSAIMQLKTKVKNTVDDLVMKRSRYQDNRELRDGISSVRRKQVSLFADTSKQTSQPVAEKVRSVNLRSEDFSKEKRSTSPFRRGMSIISKSFVSKESSQLRESLSCEKQNSTSRARSSPLRRLIDPLLRQKEPIRSSNYKQSPNSDTFSSFGSSESETGSNRRKLFSSQALLRVALRNGQPLFTFAVDNEPNILAATIKKITNSSIIEIGCVYTFFSIKEMKSRNGRWMSQGKSHDYLPDVVAQMKVSGSQSSSWNGKDTLEFVLSDVKLRKVNAQDADIQPKNELAAVVLNARNPSQSIVNVVLPSGIHSLPNNGRPCSLTQRWRTGGSCDCGGWDVGCKLKVVNNRRSKPLCPVNKFDLFIEGLEEEEAVFRLSPFKDGIYTVEFESTFSIIQAFSVCIAIIEGNKVFGGNESGKEESRDGIDTLWGRHCNEERKAERKGSSRLGSYPPIHPVGRN